MLTAYAVVTGARPADAQIVLNETLADEGLTKFETNLLSVVVNGYTFEIGCESTRSNQRTLLRLCGELNIKSPPPEGEQEPDGAKRLRENLEARPAHNPAGSEGRFAREHAVRNDEQLSR